MNKVFAITCHKITNPLVHTVRYLSSFEENIVLVHVDKKANIQDFIVLKNNNVHLIPNRIEVTWGHITQIISVIELMRFSLRFNYEFFFLLSGDDIPIKNNNKINTFLEHFFDYNFIHYQDLVTKYINPEDRVRYNYPKFFYFREKTVITKAKKLFVYRFKNIFFRNKEFYRIKNKIPRMYKGTNWFTLKKDTVKYVINYIEKNEWYLDLFNKSICGDEVFFHTIIKTNNKLKIFSDNKYPHKALRYIDWYTGPQYPKVLKEEDKQRMISSNNLFARKIDENATKDFMECFLY
ncbi:beta-1,6-N-acetylglucosaminyltransferase [Psychrobacter okhotskensis]|uniref:beta-1,6-N-acetylglucosaminyltransferase n=1 Tax=Psychrobacter okhotskensis TaxID=212403 RepID=UPI00191B1890|nr:beta-1,6-N-acetylglucosaminyltransferase [Psychrobacter okhotskensis]